MIITIRLRRQTENERNKNKAECSFLVGRQDENLATSRLWQRRRAPACANRAQPLGPAADSAARCPYQEENSCAQRNGGTPHGGATFVATLNLACRADSGLLT